MKKEIILLTGASGLLGSTIRHHLEAKHTLIAVSNSNPTPGSRSLNLMKADDRQSLANAPWTSLIHCAAFRSPDYCEDHPSEATLLNTQVPAELARMAAQRKARMIHISTDYVFDGTRPPYHEPDLRNPVNLYGKTKCDAEDCVLAAHENCVILRIPALYGAPPLPLASPFLDDAIRAAFAETTSHQDHVIIRYPTHIDDVASVVEFLLHSRYCGILHASAQEPATKYDFAMVVAHLLNRAHSQIVPSKHDPARKAPRPLDPHLDSSLLSAIGAPRPRPYSELLPATLHAYRKRKG